MSLYVSVIKYKIIFLLQFTKLLSILKQFDTYDLHICSWRASMLNSEL